jgi:hypothetical protein
MKRCYEFDVLLAEARVDRQLISILNNQPVGTPLSTDAHALFNKTMAKLEALSTL